MRLGKKGTFVACGLLAAGLVAAGIAVDHLLGTSFVFALAGTAFAGVYLVGTFGASTPLFGRVARTRRQPGYFALTFDDGPDPRFTPMVSKLIAERGHRATFFVLGRHAREYPELIVQLADDGHELASHGDDHRLLAFARPSTVRRQLEATEEAVQAAIGASSGRLFRAPHGVRSPWLGRTVAREGYRVCGWSGRVFDTANPGVKTIVARVERALKPGAVILLHDGDGASRDATRRQTVEALPAILDAAERLGLRSICLTSLLL